MKTTVKQTEKMSKHPIVVIEEMTKKLQEKVGEIVLNLHNTKLLIENDYDNSCRDYTLIYKEE